MCTFYCPNCQTPEACQSFCLFEHMQSQIDLEGELNNNISSQFIGRQVEPAKELSRAQRIDLVKAAINY